MITEITDSGIVFLQDLVLFFLLKLNMKMVHPLFLKLENHLMNDYENELELN